MPDTPTLAFLVAALVVVGATVALCLGHLDAGSYKELMGVALGAGLGVGAHSAGTKQGASPGQ